MSPAYPVIAQFVIDGEPVPKARPRLGRNGNVYTPKRTLNAENSIGWHAKVAWRREADAARAFWLEARFYLGKRERDLDNLLKAVMDALNGVIWADDKQVLRIHASKQHSTVPRTEILIREWTA